MLAFHKQTSKLVPISWRNTFRGGKKYSAASYSSVVIAFLYMTNCLSAGQQCQGSREIPNQEGIEKYAFGPYLQTCTGFNATALVMSCSPVLLCSMHCPRVQISRVSVNAHTIMSRHFFPSNECTAKHTRVTATPLTRRRLRGRGLRLQAQRLHLLHQVPPR
jgi:hypothetical protein